MLEQNLHTLIGSLALTLVFSAAPALCADTDSSQAAAAQVSAPTTATTTTDAQPAKPKKTVGQKIEHALNTINPIRMLRDREYKKASALFPAFCKDWERKLHEREVNNQGHIAWQSKDGWQTGTYVGYSPVRKCECHQSTDGYSIGKVTYDEFQYYVTGKTPDEARHAVPKVTDTTSTTELFRWDKDKWFY